MKRRKPLRIPPDMETVAEMYRLDPVFMAQSILDRHAGECRKLIARVRRETRLSERMDKRRAA